MQSRGVSELLSQRPTQTAPLKHRLRLESGRCFTTNGPQRPLNRQSRSSLPPRRVAFARFEPPSRLASGSCWASAAPQSKLALAVSRSRDRPLPFRSSLPARRVAFARFEPPSMFAFAHREGSSLKSASDYRRMSARDMRALGPGLSAP
jgi:hypothetical protein